MLTDPMDDCCGHTPIERRRFLRHCGVAAVAAPLWWATGGRAHAQDTAPPLPALADLGIRPRREWAGDLAPVGPLDREDPGDVRFLLVHHTASGNRYGPDDVPSLIRGFYDAHTDPDKGWPDVAYNFFVDRFGTVWEGREGSLSGPVLPDATGGSQGFAQLGCFVGDHRADAPTADALRAMTRLLAALADAYDIDTSPGATTTFTSRGSNRWPAGESVTAATISAHRDMSRTECPGDAAYAVVRGEFPAEVSALRLSREPVAVAPADVEPAKEPTAAQPPVPPAVAAPDSSVTAPGPPVPIIVGAVALLAAGAVAVGLRRRTANAGGPPSTGPVGIRAPGHPAGSWRVVDDPAPAGPGTTGAAIHEFGEHVLLGALAYAATPTPALAGVLDECRHAARRIDRRSRGSSARSATTLIGQALARPDAVGMDLAVLLVQGSMCTVIATEPSMGALRTAGSVSRLRPSRIGSTSSQGARVLFASSCPEDEADAVVLCSPAQRAGPSADISQLLGAAADPAAAIADYRYTCFGLTGVEPTTIGFRNG